MGDVFERNLRILKKYRPELVADLKATLPEKFVLEAAKDGAYTCRHCSPQGETYLYSKYKPREVAAKALGSFQAYGNMPLVVLGLGLGYELELLLEALPEHSAVYVIEKEPGLLALFLRVKDWSKLLQDCRVRFLLGEQGLGSLPLHTTVQCWDNTNLTKFDPEFYARAYAKLNLEERNSKKRIAVFEHVSFAEDVISALLEMGFEVKKFYWNMAKEVVEKELVKFAPCFVFTVNHDPLIARICTRLQVPYASWTVDTPSYTLYSESNKSEYLYMFVYDAETVKRLKSLGFEKVYYLPAATNINRMCQCCISPDRKFQWEVSFVGNTSIGNEYRQYYLGRLTDTLAKLTEEIIEAQVRKPEDYVIPDLIRQAGVYLKKDYVQALLKDSGITLEPMEFIPEEERVAYHLAKEASGRYRVQVLDGLAARFKVHAFGDPGWGVIAQPNFIYAGKVNHYKDLPQIYRESKINLNFTRAYVGDGGLPVRIFDVLGAGGFLITNFTEELNRLFVPGKDFAIFRDEGELVEMVGYYLEHPEERYFMAENGYRRVAEKHTFKHRIAKILDILGVQN